MRLLRVFTNPDGILGQLEKNHDVPIETSETGGVRFLRDAQGVKPCPDA